MIEELLMLTSEVNELKASGKHKEAQQIQDIINNMTNGVPKGNGHRDD